MSGMVAVGLPPSAHQWQWAVFSSSVCHRFATDRSSDSTFRIFIGLDLQQKKIQSILWICQLYFPYKAIHVSCLFLIQLTLVKWIFAASENVWFNANNGADVEYNVEIQIGKIPRISHINLADGLALGQRRANGGYIVTRQIYLPRSMSVSFYQCRRDYPRVRQCQLKLPNCNSILHYYNWQF